MYGPRQWYQQLPLVAGNVLETTSGLGLLICVLIQNVHHSMAWSESTLKSRLPTVINAMSTTIVNVFYSYSGLSLPSKMKAVSPSWTKSCPSLQSTDQYPEIHSWFKGTGTLGGPGQIIISGCAAQAVAGDICVRVCHEFIMEMTQRAATYMIR